MLSIGISEIVVIALVFVIIAKPDDYQDILASFKKVAALIFKTKHRINKEISNISNEITTSCEDEEFIKNLADGEILDDSGNKHKFYNLDDLLIPKDKKNNGK